jgi:Flp pilus assembly protein TadD
MVICIIFFISSCAWFTSSKPPEAEEVQPPETDIAPEVLLTAENFVSDGVAYYQDADYSSAILAWQEAVQLIPGDAELHNFIGIAYHKLDKLGDATTHFRIATELDSGYYQAHNNLGYLLFLREDYDGASQAFEKALDINPDYNPARLNYQKTKAIMNGVLLREVFELTQKAEKIDDLDIKIEYYSKILAMDSTYAEGHNNIGVAYYYADNVDSAFQHLEKALELKRDYPEAINNMGYIYKVAGRYQDAIKLFLRAISLKERYIIALNNLGETYYLSGEQENAKRVFRTVLEVEPGNEFAQDSLVLLEKAEQSNE